MSDEERENQELITFPKVSMQATTSNKKADEKRLLTIPVGKNDDPEGGGVADGRKSNSNSLENHSVEGMSRNSSRNTALVGGLTRLPDHAVDSKADLSWDDLCLDYIVGRKKSRKKAILTNLSGNARPGQVTAIVGSSGSGKTALLNCLTGNGSRGMTGRIVVSGSLRRKRDLRGMRHFVTDSDVDGMLLTELTVEETLKVAVDLRSHPGRTRQEKINCVTDALEEAGLLECRQTRISRLTKDARKRLAMVSELLAKPPPAILVFDDPLRDMGIASSEWFVHLLRRFAECGHTVVLSSTRPSAHLLELFDRLYMLNEGRCVYNGPPTELACFLSDCGLPVPQYHNPMDHALQALAKSDRAHRIINADPKSKLDPKDGPPVQKNHRRTPSSGSKKFFTIGEANNTEDDSVSTNEGETRFSCVSYQTFLQVNRTYPTSRFSQFCVLLQRTSRCKWRDEMTTIHRLIAAVVSSVLMGLLYYGIGEVKGDSTNHKFIFFAVYFLMLTATIPSLFTVPRDMAVFLREQRNNSYSTGVYILARTVAELPFQIILPTIIGSIIYWMTYQPAETSRFIYFLLFSFLISFVSQSLALIISLASEDTKMSMLATMAITVPLLLFCGFFKPIPEIPHYLHWVSYLSFVRYAYEGLLLTVLSKGDLAICNQPDCPPPHLAPFLPPQNFTEVAGTENWRNFLALSLFLLLFRFMSYGALKWKLYFR